MTDFNIRPVRKSEIEQVLLLCEAHAAYEKLLFSRNGQEKRLEKDLFLDDPSLFCLVVEHNSKLIAYATYMKQYATWDAGFYMYLDCLFVIESHRNKGIGEQLMSRIQSETESHNCSLIQWQTPTFNTRAIKFYKRIGASSKSKERFFLKTKNL